MYFWAKIYKNLPYVAAVDLSVTPHQTLDNSHILFCDNKLTTHIYTDWCDGITNGLLYASSKVPNKYTICINRVIGSMTDTNPTIIGYTAMRAFWEKTGFICNATHIMDLENFVFRSWHQEPTTLPNFSKLAFYLPSQPLTS